MKVLVTGGRGLLGTAVVTELRARGHEVTSFQRHASGEASREVLGDVRDAEAVARAVDGMDAVVHMAARVTMHGPLAEFEEVNIGGTRTVLAAARSAGVGSFVHISSPSVAHAGRALVGAGADPADPSSARGPYARTKAAGELLALAADSPDLAVVALRPHLVWGPGDTQLVGRIVERARARRLFLLDHGRALIDSTYIDNAAESIAQALDRCERPEVRGRAWVVSNGQPRTVAELLSRMAQAAGAPGPRMSVPSGAAIAIGQVLETVWPRLGRSDEPLLTRVIAEQLSTAHWFDQQETRRALDWTPRVSLEDGFRRLEEWYAGATRP